MSEVAREGCLGKLALRCTCTPRNLLSTWGCAEGCIEITGVTTIRGGDSTRAVREAVVSHNGFGTEFATALRNSDGEEEEAAVSCALQRRDPATGFAPVGWVLRWGLAPFLTASRFPGHGLCRGQIRVRDCHSRVLEMLVEAGPRLGARNVLAYSRDSRWPSGLACHTGNIRVLAGCARLA